jgi:hypothetical protein
LGDTTGTWLQVLGSVAFPDVIVCLPGTIPVFGRLIGQQVPDLPCHPEKLPLSKSAFTHCDSDSKNRHKSGINRINLFEIFIFLAD